MAAGSHFGCPKITLYRILYHYKMAAGECEYSNMCIRMHLNANTEYEYPMPGDDRALFNVIFDVCYV